MEDEFRCDGGICKMMAVRCNDVPECNDGTDEENCSRKSSLLHIVMLQINRARLTSLTF